MHHIVSFALLALITLAGAPRASAQAVVELVVPFAPGGSVDMIARNLQEAMSRKTGQVVVVVINHAGAGGRIGAEKVAKGKSDGSSLLFTALSPLLIKEPVAGLAPVAHVASLPYVLAGKSSGGTISALRDKTGLSMGNPGVGSFGEAVGRHVTKVFQTDATSSIPFRGESEVVVALIGGHVDLAVISLGSAQSALQAGQIKGYGLMASRRHDLMPNLPTLTEQGVPVALEIAADYGIFAPTGMPAAARAQWGARIADVVKSRDFAERMKALALFPGSGRPEELTASTARLTAIVRGAPLPSQVAPPAPPPAQTPPPPPVAKAVPQAPPPTAAATTPAPSVAPPAVTQAAPAKAIGRRVALVIGNGAYRHTTALPNPKRDAEAVAATLRRVGFAEVRTAFDLDHAAMNGALRTFGDLASDADWAMIYFAGHGIEIGGTGYILPIDARLERDTHVRDETIELARLLDKVALARQMRLVVLDACRNNPFATRMVRSAGVTRSVERGLARVEPDGDVLVAYSSKHGTVAEDGSGQNSPFVQALVEHMQQPGLDIRIMFGRVRDSVRRTTGGRQEPYLYGSMGGDNHVFVPAR